MRRRLGQAAVAIRLVFQVETPDANSELRPTVDPAASNNDWTGEICNRL
jgi:hypothetical protein